MSFDEKYLKVLKKLPGVTGPIQRLSFTSKLKWTGLILFIYFLMSNLLVYGVPRQDYSNLQFLQIVLGSSFGSLVTLGIGPIVTASIILQLLVGSKIIPWDLQSERGKAMFQGTQKLVAVLFSIVEAYIFVSFGAIPSAPGMQGLVIAQLALGGVLVIFLDEVVQKWGFGSGIGLFIVAGVSQQIMLGLFNPLTASCIPGQISTCFPTAGEPSVGRIPFALLTMGADPVQALLQGLLPTLATVLVVILVVYTQLIRVEVPLAFGALSGFGRRWPLKFFYTSNMPVILVAALLANVQLMGRMLSRGGNSILGVFDNQGNPVGGIIYYLFPPNSIPIVGIMVTAGVFVLIGVILSKYIKKPAWKVAIVFAILGGIVWYGIGASTGLSGLTTIEFSDVLRALTYTFFMVVGSVIFALFWVNTSGMDSKSVADQIESVGMYIPGHRRDPRIIQGVLDRYIPYLTIIGGAAIGALAAYADLTGAIGTGTGILLATMIVHQMYEQIASQHRDDIPGPLKKLFRVS